MAHMIDMSNNRANIAFVGATPWHELGHEMQQGESLDQWRINAGLNWQAVKRRECFINADGRITPTDDYILTRDDTYTKLGNCTTRYKPVQPSSVVEFYRDLCSDYGFTMETLGALDDGKRIWALANTGDEFSIMGQDKVKSYLLLATSYDGSMATKAMFTSVRVVCHNTLTLAYGKDSKGAISVRHNTDFDHNAVKIDLGIYQNQLSTLQEDANHLATKGISKEHAAIFVFDLLKEREESIEDVSTRKGNIINNIVSLYHGNGMGADYRSAKGTLWGLVNAVTQYVDHEQGNNVNNRFRNAQFGKGADLKAQAMQYALTLANAA